MKKPLYFVSTAIAAITGLTEIANAQTSMTDQQDLIAVIPNDELEVVPVAPLMTIDLPALSDGGYDEDLTDEELDAARGGSTIVVGNQTLNAVNSGGVINGDFSAGSISLADNALTNFNGFGNLVINTGAQNNLQSGMNVTINFAN